MPNSFLEKIWILLVSSIYLEWIIKDLIIFKKFPEYIEDFNNWIIQEWLFQERRKYAKISFSYKIVDEFTNVYWLSKSEEELYTIIYLLRNILWHSRIWIEDETIWHCPNKKLRLQMITDLFDIQWSERDTITITNENLNFELRKKTIEQLGEIRLPNLARSIWLDYSRLR